MAFDLANRSADNLPPRSQAFAAVLCASLRWAQSGDDMDQARSQYRRYVREAAYVPWSPKFGARCEAPDFRRASAFLWQTRIHSARVALRPYKFRWWFWPWLQWSEAYLRCAGGGFVRG